MTLYAIWRCITDLQDQECQVLTLKKAGATVIRLDKITGKSDCHLIPELTKYMQEMRSGDVLLVSEFPKDLN